MNEISHFLFRQVHGSPALKEAAPNALDIFNDVKTSHF